MSLPFFNHLSPLAQDRGISPLMLAGKAADDLLKRPLRVKDSTRYAIAMFFHSGKLPRRLT